MSEGCTVNMGGIYWSLEPTQKISVTAAHHSQYIIYNLRDSGLTEETLKRKVLELRAQTWFPVVYFTDHPSIEALFNLTTLHSLRTCDRVLTHTHPHTHTHTHTNTPRAVCGLHQLCRADRATCYQIPTEGCIVSYIRTCLPSC